MPAVLPQHAGSAHGGAISAVLDMVLSNGWHAASNGWTTATLEIDFKQPTPVPDIYTVRARIVEIEETTPIVKKSPIEQDVDMVQERVF